MNIQKLKYFISVAKHLNFTKAAEECYITQAAMSRQIATLERELGFPLFNRNSHTIELTKAGSVFYSDAVYLYNYYMEAMNRSKNSFDQYHDVLKIGIGSYECALIPPILERFHKKYPDISFTITEYSYPSIASAFDDYNCDFIFCQNILEKLPPKGMEFLEIQKSCWTIAVSRNSPLAQKDLITYEDLNDITIVTMENVPFKEFRRDSIRIGYYPKDYIQVNSFSAKMSAVEAGLGVAFLPAAVNEYVPDSILLIPLENAPKGCSFFAAYPDNSKKQAVHLLASFLKETYLKHGNQNLFT